MTVTHLAGDPDFDGVGFLQFLPMIQQGVAAVAKSPKSALVGGALLSTLNQQQPTAAGPKKVKAAPLPPAPAPSSMVPWIVGASVLVGGVIILGLMARSRQTMPSVGPR